MKFIYSSFLQFCLAFLVANCQATTIIPFHDLGEMSNASDMVILATAGETYEMETPAQTYWHTKLHVDFVIKGGIQANSTIELESFSTKGDGWVRIVPDDVRLKTGSSYLLFLTKTNTGFWRPILMSYGVFEQFQPGGGNSYLVPLPEWTHLNVLDLPNGQTAEPLAVYRQFELLQHLYEVEHMGVNWDMENALETTDIASFLQAIGERAAPSHCTFLNSGGTGFRWQGFPGSAVNIRYPSAGDSDCSPPTNANTYTANALSVMSGVYGGTNLVDGGTFSGFTPDCTDMTAVGNDFINWVNTNLGGYRNIVIQYNDPCSEITNLNSCAGTLAVGGLYGYTPTYQYDGMTYYQGRYGYVIVNNDVCTCLTAGNYTIVLTHEMTHSLGLGHIPAGNGTANMNPSCCNAITTLDEQCVDYFYAPPLPIELMTFSGTAKKASIELNWETASEIDNQYFEVQRSGDGQQFEKIATLAGAGTSSQPISYYFTDRQPAQGLNYYRLRQLDFDGKFSYSKVIAVHFSSVNQKFQAITNPIQNGKLRLLIEHKKSIPAEIQIIDAQGKLLKTVDIQTKAGVSAKEIWVGTLPPGHYLARLITEREVRLTSFIKA
jgi:hypothetical protein